MTKYNKIREIIEQLTYDSSVSALDIVNEIRGVSNNSNIPEIEDERKEEKEMNYILQPCPFCGEEVYAAKDQHGKILIICENCNLHFGINVEDGIELVEGWRATFPDLKTAVDAWNRRN